MPKSVLKILPFVRLLLLTSLLCAAYSHAQDDQLWFTVMGSLSDTESDTVQLNMAKVEARGKIDVMELRVNLAQQRTMENGEKYQSYTSTILIDCRNDSIVHLEQARFEGARWQGQSTKQVFSDVRPMAFGGLAPSPKERVLRAACPDKSPKPQR